MYFITNTFISFYGFRFFDNYIKKFGYDDKNSQLFYGIAHSIYLGTLSVCYLSNIINNSLWYKLCGISLGYTLYDLKHYKNNKSYDMLIHHYLMITGFMYPIFMNLNLVDSTELYPEMLSKIYLCEFSNIPLSLSFFLYYNNKTHTNLFKFNSKCTLLSYFLLRIVNFTSITYTLYKLNVYPTYYFTGLLTSLNYYWFYKIIHNALKFSNNI